MPAWDDVQYLKFADARTRPAAELLQRVPNASPAHVVDLGCGPGNSTALLLERWPSARIIGVDSSEQMLQRARSALPQLSFVAADVRWFRPEAPSDVVFANAVLQWLPAHEQLLPELLGTVAPGGTLALQMPDNWQEPSHRLMREVATRFMPDLSRVETRAAILTPAQYYDLLAPRAAWVDIWQGRYEHVMPDAAAIVEWVKGTGLRPFLEALPEGERASFLEDYERELDKAYPVRTDGKRLFTFPRLFIVAGR
jgi:trans-aconitate 2-methyltransferase